MDSAQTLHGNCKLVQTQLPSQQDKEDDISSPTLMSTPFSQSQTSPLELPLDGDLSSPSTPSQVIGGSSPSPQSQTSPLELTPLLPNEDFSSSIRSQVIGGSSPSFAMGISRKCIPESSQPQENSKTHSRTLRDTYSVLSTTTHSNSTNYAHSISSTLHHYRYASPTSPTLCHYPSRGI